MYNLIHPILFRLDPERVHEISLGIMRLAGQHKALGDLLRAWYSVPSRTVHAFGLTFSNPIGLAAGFDKDGMAWRGLACLGFGHIEVGTVTLSPQVGNHKPRLFRLPEDKALINRMGFPSMGADFVAQQLQTELPKDLVLGVNLGKSRDTPLEQAYRDYLILMPIFARLADYLVINVSSPNTEGLRRLQARHLLGDLLEAIAERRRWLELEMGKRVPILVKISPDLSEAELDDVLDETLTHGIDGVVAVNTSVNRGSLHSPLAAEEGGLSGEPLRQSSTQIVQRIVHVTQGKLPVIAVGGVMNSADLMEKLDAGATLVQVYTGLVYRGPGLVRELLRGN